MNINIRKAVTDNLKGATFEEVFKTIDDATTSTEEKVLPGLGVLFELLWKAADPTFKETLASKVTDSLH